MVKGSEQLIYNVLLIALNTGLIHEPYCVRISSFYSFETYVLSQKYELRLEFVPLEKLIR